MNNAYQLGKELYYAGWRLADRKELANDYPMAAGDFDVLLMAIGKLESVFGK